MITKQAFITQSLELNLFFLRIMKEHSIFLEASFTPKNKDLIAQAESFKNEFNKLLSQTITLSEGILPPKIARSNELVTQYTLDAEKVTENYTGIPIDTNLTKAEQSLSAGRSDQNISLLTEQIYMLNHRAIYATNMLIKFKAKIKNEVLSCKLFTTLYPAVINHILSEAQFYVKLLTKLQDGTEFDLNKEMLDKEVFWDDKLSEHAYTIRGLLDPTEKALFKTADDFGHDFEDLKKQAEEARATSKQLEDLTRKTIEETLKLKAFKEAATEGLLACKIKSIILPLLADHVLRENNHYLNLLETYMADQKLPK